MLIEDNVITVNATQGSTGVTLRYAGLEISRGTTATKANILWDETAQAFICGLNGSEGTIATQAYVTANAATTTHTHTFTSLTGKPTTLSGYGITDAAPKNAPELTGNGSISGDFVIQGNLVVNGSMTTNTSASIDGKFITLNSGETSNGVTGIYAGIVVGRGTGTAAKLIWDDNTSKFKAGLTGSEANLATESYVGTAVSAYVDANALPTSGGTVTGNVSITGDLLLGQTPSANNSAVTKLYADNIAGNLTTLTNAVNGRSIVGGTGISGGGALSSDVTIGLANTAVTPGIYGSGTQVAKVTVDAQGRLTSVSNQNIAVDFGALSNTPTTIAGYGIVDSVSTAGASFSGPVLLSGNPTGDLEAVTKNYADQITTGVNNLSSYLSGVTFSSGNGLTASGDFNTGAISYTISDIVTLTGAGTSVGGTNIVPIITYNAQGQLTSVSSGTITPSSIGAAPTANAIFTGTSHFENVSITGTFTTIHQENLTITTKTMTVNNGELGSGVSGDGISGLEVDRGSATNAEMAWVESAGVWKAGLKGSIVEVLTTSTGLALSGGSMSGAILLPAGDPVADTEATSKNYVTGLVGQVVDYVNGLSVVSGDGLTGGGVVGTVGNTLTISLASVGLTAATAVGSSSAVPVLTYNTYGQLTNVTTTPISATAIGAVNASSPVISASMVPNANDTLNLGSNSAEFLGVYSKNYYIGSNNTMSISSGQLNVSAPNNNNLNIAASGTGTAQLSGDSGVTLVSNGTSADIRLNCQGSGSMVRISAPTAITMSAAAITMTASGGTTINSNANINGNLSVSGAVSIGTAMTLASPTLNGIVSYSEKIVDLGTKSGVTQNIDFAGSNVYKITIGTSPVELHMIGMPANDTASGIILFINNPSATQITFSASNSANFYWNGNNEPSILSMGTGRYKYLFNWIKTTAGSNEIWSTLIFNG